MKNVHLTLSGSWLEKYGPIVGLMLGSIPIIAVSGPHEVLEVLRRNEFEGRPDGPEVRERSLNKRLGEFVWYVVQPLTLLCYLENVAWLKSVTCPGNFDM